MRWFDRAAKRAERLIRAVVPDLAGWPLYIVRADDADPATFGYTAPRADLYLRHRIEDWRGRGPVIAINFGAVRDYCWQWGLPLWDEFFSVAVHELGHILSRGELAGPADGGIASLDAEIALFEALTTRPSRPARSCSLPLWAGHDEAFIRVCLHLRHRLSAIGERIPAIKLCGGDQYGLFRPERYAVALGDEPERLRCVPFAELRCIPGPADFQSLWGRDLEHWFSTRGRRSDEPA